MLAPMEKNGKELPSKFKMYPLMALVTTVTANAMATVATGTSPGARVTHLMTQSVKTKSHQKPSNPAGWVTVWADFIHDYRSHSENMNSQG